MPAIALVPPTVLKDVMVLDGWSVDEEDSLNWMLFKNGNSLEIPKRGKLIAREVFESCLIDGGMSLGRFFEHCKQLGYKF